MLRLDPDHQKREIFILVLVSLSIPLSTAVMGTVSGALAKVYSMEVDFQTKLDETMASTTNSLELLQRQITSLAEVVMQNWQALNLLTAENGGTCMFLGEECCFYLNEFGIVEQNVKTLSDLRKELCDRYSPQVSVLWFSNPLVSWLLPLLGPIFTLGVLLTIAPCVLRFIKNKINTLAEVVAKTVLVQYQAVLGDSLEDLDITDPF